MDNVNSIIIMNAAEKLAVEIDQKERDRIMNVALGQLSLSIWKMEDEIILAKFK